MRRLKDRGTLPLKELRMHVALATPAFPTPRSGRNAGIERLSKVLVDGLMDRGVDVTVVTTFWNGGRAIESYGRGRIHRVKDTSSAFGKWGALADSHYWSWGFRVARLVREKVRPDIVHTLAPLASTPSLTGRGMPVVTTFHHPDEIWRMQDLLHRPFHRILESRAYHASTLLIVPSRASALAVHRLYGLPKDRIRVAYWGINVTKYRPAKARTDEEVRILYVGHHERRKGIAYLLEAVALLRRDGVPVRLVTVGDGHQLPELKRMAVDLGIADRVTFSGYVPDPNEEELPRFYEESDVFVFPSLMEGFGFVLAEAMASGVPVVASDVSAIPEVLGDAGVLFPAGDSAALAKILADLSKDARKRAELAKKGRARVEALFTWDHAISRILAVYNEAIDLVQRDL